MVELIVEYSADWSRLACPRVGRLSRGPSQGAILERRWLSFVNQGGLQQWAKEFAEKPRDSCPHFVSRRIALLPDLNNTNQRRRLLQVTPLCRVTRFVFV